MTRKYILGGIVGAILLIGVGIFFVVGKRSVSNSPIPATTSIAENARPSTTYLALVKAGDKFGFIDDTGKFVVNPQFEEAYAYMDGLAAVKVGEKWGYIDKVGKLAINPQFDGAMPFFEGLAAVQLGKKWGFIVNSSQSGESAAEISRSRICD